MTWNCGSIWQIALLFITGVFAGICNVMAGGGSLVTMPLLIFLGLDSAAANATNRLAIAVQSVSAVAGFRRKGIGNTKFCLLLTLPALPGAILGAISAARIDDQNFRRILSVVMILILVLILTQSKRRGESAVQKPDVSPGRKLGIIVAFAGIGFYSGFIQAGVGFIVIAALTSLAGLDLVRTNGYKVFIIGVTTWMAVGIFIYLDLIAWGLSFVLASGTALGGWLGSHWAVAGGEKWVRRVLTAAVLASAAKLLGAF
ncbi:sulfite exporter TauE/SafE family protein [bacterium]|nr:sulfite exporter TauE/SafE family protein [candidate division CSSED10-310 bacterium]